MVWFCTQGSYDRWSNMDLFNHRDSSWVHAQRCGARPSRVASPFKLCQACGTAHSVRAMPPFVLPPSQTRTGWWLLTNQRQRLKQSSLEGTNSSALGYCLERFTQKRFEGQWCRDCIRNIASGIALSNISVTLDLRLTSLLLRTIGVRTTLSGVYYLHCV